MAVARAVAGAPAARRGGCAEECAGGRWRGESAALRARGPVDVFCLQPDVGCWLDLLGGDELRGPGQWSCWSTAALPTVDSAPDASVWLSWRLVAG